MNYKFAFDRTPSIQLVDYLLTLGNDILGCEVGVWRGENISHMIEKCPNIKNIIAIDPYKAYEDWGGYVSQDLVDEAKQTAIKNINSVDGLSKVSFVELSATEAANNISDNSLDFVFIDGDHSFECAYEDFKNYYKKVKSGGIFAGHDYSLSGVNAALVEFSKDLNIPFESINRLRADSWFIYKN